MSYWAIFSFEPCRATGLKARMRNSKKEKEKKRVIKVTRRRNEEMDINRHYRGTRERERQAMKQ